MKLQVYTITEDDKTYVDHSYNETFVSDCVQFGLECEEMECVWRKLFNDRHGSFPRGAYVDDSNGKNRFVVRFYGPLIEDQINDTVHFVQIWASHPSMAFLIAIHIAKNWNGRLVIPEWETETHKAWLDGTHEDEDIGCSFCLDHIILSANAPLLLNQTLLSSTKQEAA
jgi:hypothetical protein